MADYTGKERVTMAYNRQFSDRVPIDIQGLNIGHLPKLLYLQLLVL